MSVPTWTAYDEGYLQAYQWSGALAGGAALPQEGSATQLGPGEVNRPWARTEYVYSWPLGVGAPPT